MYKSSLLSIAVALSMATPSHAGGWKFETLEEKKACQHSILKFQHEKEFYIEDIRSKFGNRSDLDLSGLNAKYKYEDAVREVLRKSFEQAQNDCGGDYNMKRMNFDLYRQGYTNQGVINYYSLH